MGNRDNAAKLDFVRNEILIFLYSNHFVFVCMHNLRSYKIIDPVYMKL